MTKNKKIVDKKERAAITKKKKRVVEVSSKLEGKKTVALLNVRNLPDRILQSARKQLRGKAEFMMAKNTVLKRSLEETDAKKLNEMLDAPSIIVVSDDMSAYSIYRHFKNNKVNVAAKPGQIAEEDIVVPAGETDLPPGPALSELKAAKINAMIKGGKIAVQRDSLVAKKGEKIDEFTCKALQKLGILPFKAGINMLAGVEDKTFYMADILDIDEAELTENLKASLNDAYNMSVNCSFPTQLNAEHLLTSAYMQSKGLVDVSGAYSNAHMELLLAPAIRMADALEGKVGKPESSDSETDEKTQKPKEESKGEQTEESKDSDEKKQEPAVEEKTDSGDEKKE